ncbi:hypothetical protein E2562_026073 [Oryza meyeriana var. granulata]|uniref:Uncharacterized protein n=1 Tax=Oryza meyeriana var. granulata TaxID=110450 RepID=A0A6G1E0W6_9ORYZ|nr:hypothetical protein E2562_026073 [Oryza meyeriana var. granulata]
MGPRGSSPSPSHLAADVASAMPPPLLFADPWNRRGAPNARSLCTLAAAETTTTTACFLGNP